MSKSRIARSLPAFILLLASAALLPAQGTTSLRGVVSDPQQAIVPDANVTLVQKEKGVVHTAVSQKNGEYQFIQIPPGAYSLTISAPGFATLKNDNLQLLVDTPTTFDAKLNMASTAATVDVVEDVPQLNTVNATLGNAFQQRQVQNLPLQTRNVVELLSIQPGVTQDGEVMGARRDQNNINLDGIDSNDNQNALSGQNGTSQNQGFNSAVPVPLDSVMEFRVTVAGQDATASRSSGGQVSLITRSGTNELHGSAYEYNRNTDFTANYFFNNRSGVDRPQLVRNQFGARLGGPVKKDHLFYFFNYERRIDSSQTNITQAVPTDSLKQGIVKVLLPNNTVQSLVPAQVAQVDPLHVGINPGLLKILNQYPSGNDPAYGADGGLNFTGLVFNAPNKLDSRVYVAKFDWIIDSQARNTVSFRGTLSNNNQTNLVAQLPGQDAASQLLSDNRGFSTRYTSMITPSLVNVATVGLSRIGYGITGTSGTGFTPGDDVAQFNNFGANARPSSRINPTWNVSDDITWTKGAHTVTAGFVFRNFNNNLASYANSWPNYSFSRGLLLGLGADINTDGASYLGVSSIQNSAAFTNAMGLLLGLVNGVGVTYSYGANGQVLPIGTPQTFDFITRDYEGYVQDTWKASKQLTLTFGLHYQYSTPPYEANGLQVGSTPGIDQYFAERVYAQENGIPNNQLPNGGLITFSKNGPVNGTSSWFKPDTNNFAPRIAIAYAPTSKTVVRAGAGMAYDQYGNDLVANISRLGSAGLSTSLGFANSYDFSSSPRYTGTFPALPAAPAGGFPFTPPSVSSISGTIYGINPNLVDPYSMLLNFSVSHDFGHNYSLDVSYIGRLSRKLLAQSDSFSPLIYFKDKQSGQTWVQTDTAMRVLSNGGLTPDQVKANPSLVPNNQFVQDMFPGLANKYFPGSASANYFYGIYGKYGGSDLDNLHSLDRLNAPNCITITGCYTFFAPQGSSDPTWNNASNADYHALAITFRHSLSRGLSFDLNYTWSHSIDNVSSPADNAGQFGGDVQNAFFPGQSRASSDFDIRHNFTANILYELPFGKGKTFLSSAPGWLNQVVGGWQVSSLIRFSSGLPLTVAGDEVFPTNYWQPALAVPIGSIPSTGSVHTNENGNPSLFSSTDAVNLFQDEFPGQSGARNILRMPGLKNVDIAVMKDFRLPWEGHLLQFRAEAFNAFNFVNFNFNNTNGNFAGNTTSTNTYASAYTNSINNLGLLYPQTFGEFTATSDPRVFQLSLRYSF